MSEGGGDTPPVIITCLLALKSSREGGGKVFLGAIGGNGSGAKASAIYFSAIDNSPLTKVAVGALAKTQ